MSSTMSSQAHGTRARRVTFIGHAVCDRIALKTHIVSSLLNLISSTHVRVYHWRQKKKGERERERDRKSRKYISKKKEEEEEEEEE
jgi:hypothetical protein